MKITYLTELEKNQNIRGVENLGISESQIRELEDRYNSGNPFPQAFREFLFLAGMSNNIGLSCSYKFTSGVQEQFKKALSVCNLQINRPCFVFNMVDWSFCIILLDETDDNPKVYYSHPPLAEDDSYYVLYDSGFRFDEFINVSIQDVWDFDF